MRLENVLSMWNDTCWLYKIILNTYLYECARCFCYPSRRGTIFYDKYPILLPQQTACTLCANVLYKRQRVFFLHLTLFSSFALITNELRSVRWFQNILHYPTPHLTLSYTASHTHSCHSINTSSGDGHTATAIRNAGIGGAESMMLRLIFLPPVGVQPLSRNVFSLLHGIWCASGV